MKFTPLLKHHKSGAAVVIAGVVVKRINTGVIPGFGSGKLLPNGRDSKTKRDGEDTRGKRRMGHNRRYSRLMNNYLAKMTLTFELANNVFSQVYLRRFASQRNEDNYLVNTHLHFWVLYRNYR